MRTPAKLLFLSVFVALVSSGCSANPSNPAPDDTGLPEEADIPPDLTDSDGLTSLVPDTEQRSDGLPAADYCERSMEMFCGFYIRCGRMAVDDIAACRATFSEACNARYEPYYRSLADADLLHLSESGLERCAERLATVSCDAQVFDLDGCDDLWVGHVPVGGACGLGIEGFVCVEDAVCNLDLSFCGTCQQRASDGTICDASSRCHGNSACLSGVCVRRPRGGEPCTEAGELRCVVGTSCADGACRAIPVGGAGAPCSDDRNCRYRSSCVDKFCVQASLLGGICGEGVGCASGFCQEGRCQPFAKLGEPCATSGACETGTCVAGTCGPIRWGCVDF